MLERTIRLIALHTEKLAEGMQKYPQEDLAGEVRLTPIQKQFYSWNLPQPHHYNQAMLLSSAHPMNIDSLRQALMGIVKHHDMLRAVYSSDGKQTILSVDESAGFDFTLFELESLQDDTQVRLAIEVEGQKM